MDTFIDKLAQKRNAQGMILANMAADAAKMEQMQEQMKSYDELMQEIHRVNLENADNISEVQKTLNEYMDKLEDMRENYGKNDEIKQALDQLKEHLENDNGNDEVKQDLAQLREHLESNSGNDEIIEKLTNLREFQEEKFSLANDFLHKENVKVYRNVQVAVVEELAKQTEELKISHIENRGSKALLPISILILLAVLADIAVHLFSITIPL